MQWLERLRDDLSEEGVIFAHEGRALPLLVLSVPRRQFDPPVTLAVTEVELERVLADSADDGAAVFPEVPPMVGAYRLVLTHVGMALRHPPLSGSTVTLDGGSVRVVPELPLPVMKDLPPGDYAWSAERPDGRRRREGGR